MKTIYITENQRNELEKSTSKTGRWSMMLNEETGTDRKKVMKIIADNCNRTYCKPYLMTPLSNVPDWLHNMCNPAGQEQGAWVSVKNNQHGMNRFIDFLVLNLKGQVGISHGNGPEQYIVGIARVLCQDLGFYSFGANINGGGIIGFSKLMKLIDKMPEFMLDGEVLDKNLNGLTYEEFMEKFAPRMEVYKNEVKERLGHGGNVEDKHYRIIAINDTVNSQGMVEPDDYGKRVLDMLDNYTDWCICGQFGLWEYAQYLSNGGKLYILMQDGFKDIPKERGENCPLDEYGLSLIALIVGTDGLPDNVTTRWNHEFGGENHNNMWNAEQIQELTGINYLQTFKPRNSQQLMQMHLAESKIPAAQDQVHNKVNAGIMDAVTGGGMMEEGQENLETWYRGYNSKYGSERTHLLWLTSEISYARAYGNRVEEVVVDRNKLNTASLYDIDGIVGYEFDYYDGIDEEECQKAMEEGFGGYEFEVAENEGYYCLCLWDKSCIVSRRELSREEFDDIEAIDGYDNPSYDAELNEMYCDGLLNENSNDRKVNKYIKEKFGLTDFQDIRNKVMEVYEKIPYARIEGGRYMLGVLRLLFDENLPREDYGVLNKILYKLNYTYGADRQLVNDGNLGGLSFEQLKDKFFVPDFEGDKFSTSEKIVKLPNGYTITRIDSYDEMNARCDGEWCISYDENMWYELIPNETVYLVENEELIDKFDEYYESHSEECQDIGYAAGEEDEMMEMGFLNSDLSWTNKPGSWKFPYDYYGLSRFVVLVGEKGWLTVYSRYNMPNEFDGDYLTKGQLEKLLGVKFNEVFKYIPRNNEGHYDNYGRWRVDAAPAVTEGAEPEADEYKIGGEGGNNEYFHAVNESIEMHSADDYTPMMRSIAEFMKNDGLNVYPYPKIRLNWDEQDGLFIKTGYYEPESKTIVIFCKDRHPKDILRTYAHEMIHHSQNLDGVDLNFSSEDDVKDNERLEEIESEAYLKGNVYFRKWTEYAKKDSKDVLQEGKYSKWLIQLMQRRDPDGIENLSEATDPDDIDLSSFNIKTQLNPKFWKDGRLDSRIRMKLLDIADDFIEFLGVDWVKPDDIIMTGSLANYNWNKKFSDIDLHILMDYSKVDKRTDFVDNYFYSQKKLWNDEHKDLKIFGFPVELYVQDTKEKHASTGVYSLDKDKWIREPEREKLSKSKINKSLIKNKVAEYIDKIDKLLTIYKGADSDYKIRKVSEDADKLFDDIKKERKSSLNDKEIEITNGNLIFKCLRRLGYIEKITTLMSDTYDKLNSLS